MIRTDQNPQKVKTCEWKESLPGFLHGLSITASTSKEYTPTPLMVPSTSMSTPLTGATFCSAEAATKMGTMQNGIKYLTSLTYFFVLILKKEHSIVEVHVASL